MTLMCLSNRSIASLRWYLNIYAINRAKSVFESLKLMVFQQTYDFAPMQNMCFRGGTHFAVHASSQNACHASMERFCRDVGHVQCFTRSQAVFSESLYSMRKTIDSLRNRAPASSLDSGVTSFTKH